MKYKLLFTIVLSGILCSCQNSSMKGYFRSDHVVDNSAFDVNRTYYRISDDTIVSYKINYLKVDSIVHYWDGRGYIILGQEKEKIYGSFGDGKYIVINDKKLVFNSDNQKGKLQMIKDTNSIEALIAKALIKEDTLTRITKKYFYHFLEEDRKKDSILFNTPYIDNHTIESTVFQFIKEKIEGEVYGKLIDNSIVLERIKDDIFKVRFKTISKYGYKKDHRFVFDANMESWSIKAY